MYKLHGFAQSGNAYKVAMLLQALRQPWIPVHMPFAEFANGVQRSDAWRQDVNAMGELPVLEADGKKLTQSAAIMWFLANRHGGYAGKTGDERQEVMRWLFFDNHKFTSYLATYRFLRSLAPLAPDPNVLAFLKGRFEAAAAILDKHLSGGTFIAGDRPTIADFSVAGYVYYPIEEHGYDWAKTHPGIHAWTERMRALPGWKGPYELMPGERTKR